ncbi:MAG TPA: sigma-70 family RNA polymerase sigma factor [Opitutaceae bacterium]|nr:sigma-70 family RNA polymerase sigma factor [Opitutaceae bacterium]
MPSFEEVMLPHMPNAYNLARWLLRNEQDAEDSVQEAFLRAYKAFGQFRGGDGRAWLLTIVRNVCYSRLRKNKKVNLHDEFDESVHGMTAAEPETAGPMQGQVSPEILREAMSALPEKMSEMIVLHDLEGMPYREIAEVVGIPIGTVMSRLARARERLHRELLSLLEKEASHGV